MEEVVKEITVGAVRTVGAVVDVSPGDGVKAVAETVSTVGDIMQEKKELKERKLRLLENKDYDMNYQYNRIILDNFVKRAVQYYGKEKKVSTDNIKDEIEKDNSFLRNIIITGQAGSGKSTVLKWMFLNSSVPECGYIFLYSRMFSKCKTLDDVFADVMGRIPKDKKSIVFWDGIDELQCIRGTEEEFNRFIRFFDKESNPEYDKPDCRFVISSRPEHFGFHEMIIKRNAERDLDNYVVFELGKLSKEETSAVCRSIQKLYQFDQEDDYLKLLNTYLNMGITEDFLLDTPLLCRCAYQIIDEWNLQGNKTLSRNEESLSSKVEKVFETYIKAEFQDECRYQKEDGNGKLEFDAYRVQVWEFLTDLAGTMGQNESIDKEIWRKLKKVKNIKKINRAFCGLEEVKDSENEELMFIHNAFRYYFLARYFASAVDVETDIDKKSLKTMLESGFEFAVMYVEQLKDSANAQVRKIREELMAVTGNDKEQIVKYAKGEACFIYMPESLFTIEDYLMVFPSGRLMYAGIIFDKDKFDRLIEEGVFSVQDAGCLDELDRQVVTKKEGVLKGLKFELPTMRRIMDHFWVYQRGTLRQIFGVQEGEYEVDLAKADAVRREYVLEHDMLFKIRTSMINILGDEKEYWCLFNGTSLFVYQMIKENEEKMKALFHEGYSKDVAMYVAFYGTYRALTENENFFNESKFKSISEVSFEFDESKNTFERKNDLAQYYDVYYSVRRLFESKINAWNYHIVFEGVNREQEEVDRIQEVMNRKIMGIDRELSRLQNEIEETLQHLLSEKLRLYFTDELLYVLYLRGKGEDMVRLAWDTMNLCRKFGHIEGIGLREYLRWDELSFNREDMQKIYRFSKSYVWI